MPETPANPATPASDEVEDHHDWLSDRYVDDWVADWSGRQERPSQLRRVAVGLPVPREAPITVLDVGGGWGPLTEQVLDYRPRATVTLVDFSPPMLAHARQRLAPYGTRVRLIERDLSTPDWARGLGSPFDAVVSSLAIHNLGDPRTIAQVYADIFGLLRPGGWFFNLEIVFPAGPALGALARRLHVEAEGGDPDEVEPAPPTAAADPDDRRTDGGLPPRSLAQQLALLGSAGFAEVDCLWHDGVTALLAAVTPP